MKIPPLHPKKKSGNFVNDEDKLVEGLSRYSLQIRCNIAS